MSPRTEADHKPEFLLIGKTPIAERYATLRERLDPMEAAKELLGWVQETGTRQVIGAAQVIAQAHGIELDIPAVLTAYSHGSILTGEVVRRLAEPDWKSRLRSPEINYDEVDLVLVGGGKMGGNMARLLNDQGLPVKVVDPSEEARAELSGLEHVSTYEAMGEALAQTTGEKPRVVVFMIPAHLVPKTAEKLLKEGLLGGNDVVADFGNTHYAVTSEMYEMFDSSPVHYLAGGTSGGILGLGGADRGVRGARYGACFMVDGEDEYALRVASPVLGALALDGKFAVVGSTRGGGHEVKGLHNEQEYVEMEALGQVVEHWLVELKWEWSKLLEGARQLQQSDVGSYLTDCLVFGLQNNMVPPRGSIGGQTIGEMIALANEARFLGAPLPLAEEAIETRVISDLIVRQTPKTQIIYMLRQVFGGHTREAAK